MSLARVYTRAQLGIEAPRVVVEVHLTNGLPMIGIVGLAETSVKESRDRVRSAIMNSGFDFPSARRILVNMSPADLPKSGGRYDLAIAIGILVASGQLQAEAVANYEFAAELGLNGDLRSTNGLLPFAVSCARAGNKMILSVDDLSQTSLVEQASLFAAKSLREVCEHFIANKPLITTATKNHTSQKIKTPDLSEVRGQYQARRALEIAAAGGHNLLMSGPPGTGKTMLASRLPSILPPLENSEALDVASVYSVVGHSTDFIESGIRPFRSPHHTASGVALVGGGSYPKPGEISLAHRGVLFLDELTEYDRRVLDVLREPLESGEIRISRANLQVCYPAQFQLVAAMNPCPCGYLGTARACGVCSQEQIQRYKGRISGPLLDRIDLHIEVPELKKEELFSSSVQQESSQIVRARVLNARAKQMARQKCTNHNLAGKDIERMCSLDKEATGFLQSILDKLHISARSFHKILRVARTIADLDDVTNVRKTHLLEAVSYRSN